MSEHTKGPWDATEPINGGEIYIDETGTIEQVRAWIATVHTNEGKNVDVAVANARLIAAAPEMYEALKLMIETHNQFHLMSGTGFDFEKKRQAAHAKCNNAALAIFAKIEGKKP